MDNFKFIKLSKNSKIPIKNECFKDAKPLNTIDIKKYNIGLVAGVNNLIILDIDVKDGGIIEWNEYKKVNFEPYTMTQKTPSGGFHYIFLHTDPKYTPEQVELINRLKNKSKYRGVGLDIRKDNGYIVFSPSTIEAKQYTLINDTQPALMPSALLKWLLEHETHQEETINNNLVLIRDIEEVKTILNKFNNVSSSEWFSITTALKNLVHKYNNIQEETIKTIWDEWSKNQPNYNKSNNKKIWKTIKANINFNYIINKFNETIKGKKDKMKPLESFKPMIEIKNDVKTIEMNNNYIFDEHYTDEQFNYNVFNEYETIIIKSTTGTGKTSNTAKHIKKYMEDKPHLKVLSLIDRISLSHQHLDSFKKAGLNMVSYQDETKNIEDDNIIICLNSLVMFAKYSKEFFNNYIVYIDEVTSFLFSLTHNDTLNHVLKMVYVVLMKIINNCHKIIVSDATIYENTHLFFNKRNKDKTIFINNSFTKYEGIKAYKLNDENDFLNLLKEHVTKKKYFLLGCDSKTIADKFYLELNTDQKEKYTSEERREIKDASTEFKNKFIVYSPSITTGVDFSIDEPQDVFLYIKGCSISPVSSFQQLSRTRNIKRVFYYVNETNSKPSIYSSIADTKTHFKNICATHSKLSDICFNIIDDEQIFNENSFFNIFVFNEYITDIFNTNKKQHFKNILSDNKFKLRERGKIKKLNKGTERNLKENLDNENNIKFRHTLIKSNITTAEQEAAEEWDDKIKEASKRVENLKRIPPEKQNNVGFSTYEDALDVAQTNLYNFKEYKSEYEEELKNKELKANEQILNRMKFINITDKQSAEKYNDIIKDPSKFNNYLNFARMLKDDKYINDKLTKEKDSLTKYKAVFTNYYKISLISQLEKEMNIKRFDVAKLEEDKPLKLSDELNKKINSSFRCSEFPNTFNECILYYINKVKHLLDFINIFNCERIQKNKKRERLYTINQEEFKKYFGLYVSSSGFENIIQCPLIEDIKKEFVQPIQQAENIDFIDVFEFPDKDGLDFGL